MQRAFEPGPDPIAAFVEWFREAEASGEPMPESAALATATKDGSPSVRVVLWRGFVDGGFAFYTNYDSRKARDLDENPRAALTFHFVRAGRQVRVEGGTLRVSRAASEVYFTTRPRDSQLGAWASPQSSVIEGRDVLQHGVEAARARFEGREVPCPPNWGGYRLLPERIELWQQGEHRLHDRMLYVRVGAIWRRERLAP